MNSIFRKQFFLLTAGLLLSFTLLAVGLIQAFNSYFYNQKESELFKQAAGIETIYNRCYTNGIMDYELFKNRVLDYDVMFQYSFVVVNDSFNISWQAKDGDSQINIEKIKESPNFADVFKGESVVFKRSIFKKIHTEPYTIGYPIKHDDTVVAAVYLTSSMKQITATTYDSYRIIIVFMCIAILLNFIIIYMSSKQIADSLKQMSDAAKVIAGGDFEKRLDIHTDDEVGALAESFNEMAMSLFMQDKQRREFISNISHDLRSPLTSMRGFLQAILDGTIPVERQAHYIKIVLDESERLAKMANDMLDINKLDNSQKGLNLTQFDINELAQNTMFNFEARAMQNKIKLSCEFCNKETIVKADADKIQRVIYNLIDNALKFTHKYGYVKIITQIKDKKVYISVKDNGKGISPDEQKRVFDRLYKGDKSRGKDKKGSGLGLTIVKEFIKAHGEEIKLTSELGKGCTFTFTLPLIGKGEPIVKDE